MKLHVLFDFLSTDIIWLEKKDLKGLVFILVWNTALFEKNICKKKNCEIFLY